MGTVNTLDGALKSYGLSSAARAEYKRSNELLRERYPEGHWLISASFEDVRSSLKGDTRKTAPETPSAAHSVLSDYEFIRIAPTITSTDDLRRLAIQRSILLTHDVPEDLVSRREKEYARLAAREQGLEFTELPRDERIHYLPSQERRTIWRRDEVERLEERQRARARERASRNGGVSLSVLYGLIDEQMHPVEKLQRERRGTEYVVDEEGKVQAMYPLHVLSITKPTVYKGVAADSVVIARALTGKSVERGQGTPELRVRPQTYFGERTNTLLGDLQPEALLQHVRQLREVYSRSRREWRGLVRSHEERHAELHERLQAEGVDIMYPGTRFMNLMKNVLVLAVSTRWMRNKALNGSLDRDLDGWDQEALRNAMTYCAGQSLRQAVFEQHHVIVNHGIEPSFADALHRDAEQYFSLPQSWRRTTEEDETSIPEFLQKFDDFLSRNLAYMYGERDKEELDQDYHQQLLDAIEFEFVFKRFLENAGLDADEMNTIHGDLF